MRNGNTIATEAAESPPAIVMGIAMEAVIMREYQQA